MSETPCNASLEFRGEERDFPISACKEDLGHPGPHVGFIDGCVDYPTMKPVSGEVRWWTP